MVKLSIVFPIYNAEKHIKNKQQFLINNKSDEVEFIFVDDGSTDDSYVLLKQFEERYSIAKAIHISNHGAPYARNLGLSCAQGDYVWFFDIDDEMSENAIQQVIECINTIRPDFIIGGMEFYNEKSKVRTIDARIPKGFIENKVYIYMMDSFPINKIYRKEIICSNGIKWDDVRIHQDLNFYLKCIPYINSIYGISEVICRHIEYNGGTISTTVSPKIVDTTKAVALVRRFYRTNKIKGFNQIADYHLVKNVLYQTSRINKLKLIYIPYVYLNFRTVLKKISVKDNKFIPYDMKDKVKKTYFL